MTTPDTLPECQQLCEKLKEAIWRLADATTDLARIAVSFQLDRAEYQAVGRARNATGEALSLAGKPSAVRTP